MTRLHLQRAIVARLYVRKVDVVNLTPETVGRICVGKIVHLGRTHECCLARTRRGSLPCRRYILTPLTGNEEGGFGLVVIRERRKSTPILTNIHLTPADSKLLHPHGDGSVALRKKTALGVQTDQTVFF